MSAIYSLFVVNKSGGLIYSKDFSPVARVDVNDLMRLASMWHSMSAISCQIAPVPSCTGIEVLEADTFDMHAFQSGTGTKFLLVVEPKAQYIPTLLAKIYELYSDYALKNPFYEVEMPIRCELFDEHVEGAVRRYPMI